MSKKNHPLLALFLTFLLTGCVALTPIPPTPTTGDGTIPAVTATPGSTIPQPTTDLYTDPAGQFSAPIPANWTVEEGEGYARLASPDDGILIYLLTVQADDAASAAVQGWQAIDPAFDREVTEQTDAPAQGGLDGLSLITYEYDEANERFYQAVARLYDGTYYLLLIDGDITAIQQRQAQISIIDSGFTISALAETDLTGVEPRPVRDVLPALEAFIEEGLTQFGIPGAAVAIVEGGDVVYSRGFGVTAAGGDTPITPQTQMMIGSTGKSLTTMLMATLVDEGVITWDTPVVDVLPEFAVSDPELTQSITLRNLVCACTGVPRRDLELFFNANDLSAEAIVNSLRTFTFFTDFGEAFQYSNQLVATGGYAAAAATGVPFGDLLDGYGAVLQRNILSPIGMDNTTISFAEVRARENYAIPHDFGLNGMYNPLPLEFEEILIPVAPAGSHWSTLEDMTNYLLTELAVGVAPDGTRVVSEENLRETWQPQVPVSADSDYGLGWFVGDYRGLQLIEHGGNTLGFTSSFGFLPELDLGVIVLTNGRVTNYFNDSVRARLLELIFDQEAEVPAALQFSYEQIQDLLGPPDELLDAVEPAAVAPYLGIYTNEALGDLTLRLEGDALIADVGEFAIPLLPVTEEDEPDLIAGYYATEPPLTGLLFEFSENADGERVVEFGQGALAYTFVPVGN
jgi:CubicO group peptidase (beta-lactamase class C family)